MYYNPVETGNYSPTLGDLEKMGIQIFDDSWSTYVPEYKATLEHKILKAYHFNQIGCDTPERFVYYLNSQLAQIMPYYNQLYMSELIKFNPLLNHSIQASGRSIENLLTKANTTDDKFSKAIRDFVGSAEKSENVSESVVTAATGKKDFAETTQYNKDGTSNEKHLSETVDGEQETTKDNFYETVKTDNTSNQNTDTTVTGMEDKTVTETPTDTTTKVTEWGGILTTKTDKDEKTTSKGDGSKHWKETIDDDSTTHTTVGLVESGTRNTVQEYADTPQVKLDTDTLRSDYLTNVTWTDEKNSHKADTTTDTKYEDDQTKEHDETYHDTGAGTKINNDKETATKSGSDKETSTRGGEIKTVTDDKTSSHTVGTITTIDAGTKTTGSQDVKERELNSKETVNASTDKPWEEKGTSTTTGSSTDKKDSAQDSKSQSTGAQNTREVANTAQSSTNNVEKRTEETTDTGTSNVTQGFMNVSPSALLEAFRKTFLNIDAMIIHDLRENFMLVF